MFCPLLFSVLWLDTLSIRGGQRLSAFGCQNGCVGLALVKQEGPGVDPSFRSFYILLKLFSACRGPIAWSTRIFHIVTLCIKSVDTLDRHTVCLLFGGQILSVNSRQLSQRANRCFKKSLYICILSWKNICLCV